MTEDGLNEISVCRTQGQIRRAETGERASVDVKNTVPSLKIKVYPVGNKSRGCKLINKLCAKRIVQIDDFRGTAGHSPLLLFLFISTKNSIRLSVSAASLSGRSKTIRGPFVPARRGCGGPEICKFFLRLDLSTAAKIRQEKNTNSHLKAHEKNTKKSYFLISPGSAKF